MKLNLLVVFVFYGLLAGGAALWAWLRGEPGLWVHGPGQVGLVGAAACGVGLGLLTVAMTRLLLRGSTRLRRMGARMGRLLGPLDTGSIVVLSVCSALGEELFFRGAMQPSWGLVLTALAFGGVHIGPDRSFLPWTLMAVVLGFALGGLLLLTGNLVAPILAHFTINYFNLHLVDTLRRKDAG